MIKMAQLEHIKKLYHLEGLSIREISKVTGQWARNSMVKEGLLKAASPRGVWEI